MAYRQEISEKQLIQGCIKKDRKSQELLYSKFSREMFGVCLGYSKDYATAKDILQEGFIKVFVNIKFYKGDCPLKGWIRRIVVNTCIDYYRKSVRLNNTVALEDDYNGSVDSNILERITANELLELIRQLPEGYRMVFNLYVIEGYSHKEIAKKLEISEGTSKSQLSRAKKILQEMVTEHFQINYNIYARAE